MITRITALNSILLVPSAGISQSLNDGTVGEASSFLSYPGSTAFTECPRSLSEIPGSFSHSRCENAGYDDISRIYNSRFADFPLSGETIRFVDTTRDPRCVLYRWIATSDDGLCGFAELTQSSETYHPTRFQFRICVSPEVEGKGLEEELLETVLEEFRHHRGLSLRSLIRDDQVSMISVLEGAGFKPSMRFLDKALNLKTYESEAIQRPYAALPEGISVKTLRELRSDPECHRKLFKLETTLRQDAPFPEDTTMRFDYFETAMLEHPELLPDGYLVAMDGERYVGICSLSQREGNRTAYINITGVLADSRKRGIARHLKSLAISHARFSGYESMLTSNEENNQGIADINELLGFRVVSSRTSWVKAF